MASNMTNTDNVQRRAGLYMRISRDVSGEALGVGRQEEDCRAVAEQMGWAVVEVYVDNDISATSGKPRPAYRKMLADLETGHIDAILAWHPDRLYRRAVDLSELVECVQRNKVPVATAKSGDVDLNSPTGLLVAEMLAAIAMYEVRHKSERWSRSWRQQREMGQVTKTGSRMFGYTQEGAIVPDEAEIAREMAARIGRGDSIISVGRWLEAEGIVATRGSAWTNQSIKRFLCNPRLAGWSTLNGEVVARGQWEPILDQETFETVRAILTARTFKARPRKSVLVGLIFCAECGHRLVTSGASGERTYRCPSRPGMRGCGGVSVRADKVEEIVEHYAKKKVEGPELRESLQRLRESPGDALAEIASLDNRVRDLEAQLEEPDVPVATLLRAIDRTKQKREEALNALAGRSGVELPASGHPWPADLQRRRSIIELVVERVEIKQAVGRTKSGSKFNPERVSVVPR